jgi:hypothetical protein
MNEKGSQEPPSPFPGARSFEPMLDEAENLSANLSVPA